MHWDQYQPQIGKGRTVFLDTFKGFSGRRYDPGKVAGMEGSTDVKCPVWLGVVELVQVDLGEVAHVGAELSPENPQTPAATW